MRLEERVAIVVGASRGIGIEIAKVFAEEGAQVLLVGRSKTDLETLKEAIGERAAIYVGDITRQDDMEKMVEACQERYGRVDILCQNAGIYPQVPLVDMSADQWDEVLDTNLKGTFFAVKACLSIMQKQGYGRIVLTSSISGPKTGWPGGAHYTASKAGMNGFLRTAAVELAKDGITINAVEPGNVATETLDDIGDEWVEGMRRSIPMGRIGSAREVAKAHLFFASDDSSYITGQTLVVDGGQILPESPFLT